MIPDSKAYSIVMSTAHSTSPLALLRKQAPEPGIIPDFFFFAIFIMLDTLTCGDDSRF